MLLEKDVQRIFSQLEEGMPTKVSSEGSDIHISFVDNSSKLSLSSQVYYGGNYIPSSVRRCLQLKPPFSSLLIRTSLKVDEPHFQINLNYLGQTNSMSYLDFKEILEEFTHLAEEWKLYLDEHDRNDLVYIHSPR